MTASGARAPTEAPGCSASKIAPPRSTASCTYTAPRVRGRWSPPWCRSRPPRQPEPGGSGRPSETRAQRPQDGLGPGELVEHRDGGLLHDVVGLHPALAVEE